MSLMLISSLNLVLLWLFLWSLQRWTQRFIPPETSTPSYLSRLLSWQKTTLTEWNYRVRGARLDVQSTLYGLSLILFLSWLGDKQTRSLSFFFSVQASLQLPQSCLQLLTKQRRWYLFRRTLYYFQMTIYIVLLFLVLT